MTHAEEALAGARHLREAMGKAAQELERAAAGPAGAPDWLKSVGDRLHELRTALIAHIDEVEASGGLLDQILDDAPRLEPAVETIRQEHGVLCEEIDQALDLIDPHHHADATAMREIVLDVTRLLYRHRQRGSDLVYDAYDLDIGGGG